MTDYIKKLRSHKIAQISIFDLSTAFIGTILIFIIIRQLFFRNKPIELFVLMAITLTIPLGIAFHFLFKTKTTLNYNLGLSEKPE